jgi:hypothetical protein
MEPLDFGRLSKPRRNGVSGFMRLRNEAEFLALAVRSFFGLDELVIVYNSCSDETPAIARECARMDPDRIKIFEYEPIVYPPGSAQFMALPEHSPHSLVSYYNFALLQTCCRWAVKVDGDQIGLPMFNIFCEMLRRGAAEAYYTFQGINLWRHDDKLHVNLNRPLTGGKDQGFFPVSGDTFYIKSSEVEQEDLNYKVPRRRVGEPLFYHLKGVKRDRGLALYNFDGNDESKLRPLIDQWYSNPKLVSVRDYLREFWPTLPPPESLGVRLPAS